MRKAILYVAISLDGYLADEQGGLDWILEAGNESPEENPDNPDNPDNPETAQVAESSSYEIFYDSVDTIIMGRVTYEQITQEICPDIWMYGGKKTIVLTKTPQAALPDIEFSQREPEALLRYLKNRKGKDIWICGGATLISAMMAADLIDEYHISVVPVLLGKGIGLFSPQNLGRKLELCSCEQQGSTVDLVYRPIQGEENKL